VGPSHCEDRISHHRGRRGQATIEWVGLVLLVSFLALALVSAGVTVPGLSLVESLGTKLICLAGLDVGHCLGEVVESPLASEYGAELAAEVTADAPRIEYEQGMRAVPVDFRRCREDPCSLGPETGEVDHTDSGEPVTLFVHAVDCRTGAVAQSTRRGYDCSGERAGHLYLQYWAYYPGSQSLRGVPGNPGFHHDDWESFQLKLGSGETLARASSHHGYNYTGGVGSWLNDAGITSRSAWGTSEGRYYVSGGSHAGHAHEASRAREPIVAGGRASAAALAARLRDEARAGERFTPGSQIHLVPIESIPGHGRHWRFAISPPWRKHVYRDPEYNGTD
jgi:hypothetical protein